MFVFPIFITLYAGFTHAFEADHLLAVGNIVSKRNDIKLSVKDGIFWGLGHAATIFFIGILMLIFKAGISPQYFQYFEAAVGVMLVVLAVYRLIKFYSSKKNVQAHSHVHSGITHKHRHSLAFGVGLVHGLAGSGALVIVAMSQIKTPLDGLAYLLVFAFACIAGMMLAAGLCSIPFSKKIINAPALQSFLILVSCLLCLLYGGKVIYQNLLA